MRGVHQEAVRRGIVEVQSFPCVHESPEINYPLPSLRHPLSFTIQYDTDSDRRSRISIEINYLISRRVIHCSSVIRVPIEEVTKLSCEDWLVLYSFSLFVLSIRCDSMCCLVVLIFIRFYLFIYYFQYLTPFHTLL